MPLALASFFKSTWDYTLYSEGFLAPVIRTQYGLDDHESPFISLAEIMNHQTLDTALLSIAEADQMILNHQGKKDWQKTPNELADQLLQNANVALQIINELEISDQNALMTQSLNGLTIWCYLSQYFGFKLKAGMILSGNLHNRNPNHKSQALDYLNRALEAWEKLSELADTQYYEVPYWESRVFHGDSSLNSFSWSKYLPQVKKDIDWAKGL